MILNLRITVTRLFLLPLFLMTILFADVNAANIFYNPDKSISRIVNERSCQMDFDQSGSLKYMTVVPSYGSLDTRIYITSSLIEDNNKYSTEYVLSIPVTAEKAARLGKLTDKDDSNLYFVVTQKKVTGWGKRNKKIDDNKLISNNSILWRTLESCGFRLWPDITRKQLNIYI